MFPQASGRQWPLLCRKLKAALKNESGKAETSDMTTAIQDLFLYGAFQALRKRGSHKLCAKQVHLLAYHRHWQM